MINCSHLIAKNMAIHYHLLKLSTLPVRYALLLSMLSTVACATQNTTANAIAKPSIHDNTAQVDYPNNQTYDDDNAIEAKDCYPERIFSEQTVTCKFAQLKYFQQPTMNANQQYLAYQAQAWLNYAYAKSSIHFSALSQEYASRRGETILQILKAQDEAKINVSASSFVTNIPEHSALMRADLWATLIALKQSGGIKNAPRALAFSEVNLIRGAAEYCQYDLQQAGNYFLMADRWLEQAREAFVETHDSVASRALEDLTVSYYELYAPLEASDNVCKGKSLPLLTP